MLVTYNRKPFRSILERNFAQYFDTLGVEWQYEPLNFGLANPALGVTRPTFYTPDFFLPASQCFLECKPTRYEEGKEPYILLNDTDALKLMLFFMNQIQPSPGFVFCLATETREGFDFHKVLEPRISPLKGHTLLTERVLDISALMGVAA